MQLSASTISTFLECPRCFYLDRKLGKPRPRGIFPSLPSGMDNILKKYSDEKRAKGKASELLELPEKHFFYQEQTDVKKWRHWKSGLKYYYGDDVLIGAIDDVLVNPRGQIVPFDFKTRSSKTSQASAEKYYQKQLDIYALLLSTTEMEIASYGVLLSLYPDQVLREDEEQRKASIIFRAETFILEVSTARAESLFQSALDCLAHPEIPPSGPDCEYCKWHSNLMMSEPAGY